jgi:deoxyribose-phosphate aldolase
VTTDSPRPEDQSPEVDDALARRAITLIDLIDLADDHSVAGIDDLCARAKTHGTAAVCVWPEHVARCVANLSGSGVRVATVVNFPTGEEPIGEVLATTQAALDAGADDIDVVLPYRAFLDGDREYAGRMVAEVAALISPPNLLKVILESGELVDPELVAGAAALAIENGADFVKTSTGKVPAGASISAATAMVGAIAEARDQGRSIGLKPSGGIRSYADAASYLDVAESVMGSGWATPATFRFGASGLLDALLEVLDGSEPSSTTDPNGY